jgi:NAD(P)-dependent dehydrogenase (short-subunit alcohol dehydrogenase family)
MAVRNTSLGERAAADIRAQHPSAKITVMSCDLSSLQSVKQFAADFQKTGKPCHVLLANAGVMMCPFSLTTDGHEMQFGTNHLGHFVLVSELLPVLKKTGTKEVPARVVVLSSAAHFRWARRRKRLHGPHMGLLFGCVRMHTCAMCGARLPHMAHACMRTQRNAPLTHSTCSIVVLSSAVPHERACMVPNKGPSFGALHACAMCWAGCRTTGAVWWC